MSTFRIHKNTNYTSMSNFHLRDKSLSWQAMGMLSFMLSNSESFNYSIQGLAQCASNGESSVRSVLKELKEHGYLNVFPVSNAQGRIVDWQYDIYEKPHEANPVVENPHVENQTQSNTNISSITNSPIINNSSITNTLNKENAKQSRKIKKELDLSFVSIHFADVFNKWLEYKKERKQSYTQIGAESCYRKLIELSNNDPYTADKIVEQSIANNYQGLFALKENGNSTSEKRMSLGQALGEMLRNGGCPMPHNQ